MVEVLRAPGMGKCIGCYSCMLACARYVHSDYSPHKSAIQVRTQGGMQGRLVADICRACVDAHCAFACPTGALSLRLLETPSMNGRLDPAQLYNTLTLYRAKAEAATAEFAVR
ncbi:MAG: 4Fe-4S dicluster domain-containing protein [Anaerolineae bacterium]